MARKSTNRRGKKSKPAEHTIPKPHADAVQSPGNSAKPPTESVDPSHSSTSKMPTHRDPAYAQIIAESEAWSFHAMKRLVYPGVLLVLRNGESTTFPVGDDKFDPTCERPYGIAFWGAVNRNEGGPGVLSVEEDGADKLVMIACHDDTRPLTGIGQIDAWIVRTDTLRRLRLGIAFAPGHEQLSPERWRAAIVEVEYWGRQMALALIKQAPDAKHQALRALARVADTQSPTAQELSEAIQELMVAAQSWNASNTSPSVIWIRSDEASKISGLTTDAFRKRAKKEKWETKPEGKYFCLKESDLINTWPTHFQH